MSNNITIESDTDITIIIDSEDGTISNVISSDNHSLNTSISNDNYIDLSFDGVIFNSGGGGGNVSITSPLNTIKVSGYSNNYSIDLDSTGAVLGDSFVFNGTRYAPKALSLDDLSDVAISDQTSTTWSQISTTPVVSFGQINDGGNRWAINVFLSSSDASKITTGSIVSPANNGTLFTVLHVNSISATEYTITFSNPPVTTPSTWGGQSGLHIAGQLWLQNTVSLSDGEVVTWNATTMKWEARIPHSSQITNMLSSAINSMTSSVNGVSSSATIVNSNTITTLDNTITSNVNSVSSSANIVNEISGSVSNNQLTISVNKQTSTPISLPASSSSTTSFYQYRTNTTTQSGYPGNGQLSWNNATQISSNTLFLSHLTADNVDIDLFLAYLTINNKIIIQDSNNSDNSQVWTITNAPTHINAGTSTSYFSVPVSLNSSSGTGTSNFTNNHQVIAVVVLSVASITIPKLMNLGTTYIGDNAGIIVKINNPTPVSATITINSIGILGSATVVIPTPPLGANTYLVGISSADNTSWAGVGAVAQGGLTSIAWIKPPDASILNIPVAGSIWYMYNTPASFFVGYDLVNALDHISTSLILSDLKDGGISYVSDDIGSSAVTVTYKPFIDNEIALNIGSIQTFTSLLDSVGNTSATNVIVNNTAISVIDASNNASQLVSILTGVASPVQGTFYPPLPNSTYAGAGTNGGSNALLVASYGYTGVAQASVTVNFSATAQQVSNIFTNCPSNNVYVGSSSWGHFQFQPAPLSAIDAEVRGLRYNTTVGATNLYNGLRLKNDTVDFTSQTISAGLNTYWDTDPLNGNPRINANIPVSLGKGWVISIGYGLGDDFTVNGWSLNNNVGIPRFKNDGTIVLVPNTFFVGIPPGGTGWGGTYSIANTNFLAQAYKTWNNSFSDALQIVYAGAEDVFRFSLHTDALPTGINPTQTDAQVKALWGTDQNPILNPNVADAINSISYDDVSGTYEYQRAQGGTQIITPTLAQVLATSNTTSGHNIAMSDGDRITGGSWQEIIFNGKIIGNDVIIASGTVTQYLYRTRTLYHYVSTAEDVDGYSITDAFYTTFDGVNIPTGLVSARFS